MHRTHTPSAEPTHPKAIEILRSPIWKDYEAGVHIVTKPAMIGWATTDSAVVPKRNINSTQLLDAGGRQ